MFKIRESCETETSFLAMGKDGILRHRYKKNAVLERRHSDEQTEAFLMLTRGTKYPCILLAEDNVNFTREYRERSRELESITPVTCFAAVTNLVAYRIIANFYLKFHKPKLPFRLFSNEEDAILWMKKKGYLKPVPA